MISDVTPWLGYKKPDKMDEKYKIFSPRNILIPLDKETIIFMKNKMLYSFVAYNFKINQVKSMSVDGRMMPSIKLRGISYSAN